MGAGRAAGRFEERSVPNGADPNGRGDFPLHFPSFIISDLPFYYYG